MPLARGEKKLPGVEEAVAGGAAVEAGGGRGSRTAAPSGGAAAQMAERERFLPLPLPVASLDSTAQTGHAKGADWQEELYQKVISVIYFSFDGVHVCHSLAKFQWKKVSGDWSK